MRRFILPAVVLAVAIVASVLAGNANEAAEPDDPSVETASDRLGTPLLSARRTPEWLRQPTVSNLLDTAVRAPVEAVGDAGFACVSVHVNGTSVTELASDLPFIPGEAHRLLTLAALDTVGTGTFTTEVARDVEAVISDEGVLEGDLWLIGGADPVLATNAYISRFTDGRAFTSLEELALSTAAALRDQGITAVAGRLIGVDPKYSGYLQSYPEVWTTAEINSGTVGVTSGLLVDNGLSSFSADSLDATANVRAADGVAHAAGQFQSLLVALGVPVASGSASGDAPPAIAREIVASIESPALSDIARRALVDATTAEMLWREIAIRGGGTSESLAVLFGINAALVELGLLTSEEADSLPKLDGSGLSLKNRARCDTLTGVLDPDSSILTAQSLPTAAESAVTECAPDALEDLRVVASARPEVTSMAGRATAPNGDIITFSVLANWLPDESGTFAPQDVCDGLLPRVLDAIAQHPAGPVIGALTPLDPVPAS